MVRVKTQPIKKKFKTLLYVTSLKKMSLHFSGRNGSVRLEFDGSHPTAHYLFCPDVHLTFEKFVMFNRVAVDPNDPLG